MCCIGSSASIPFDFTFTVETVNLCSLCSGTELHVVSVRFNIGPAMKITDVLRAEHAVFHSLFDYIETVLPDVRTLAEVKSLAAIMEKLTGPHSRTEDELLIDPLESCFDQIGHRETFHQEHELIETTLARTHHARSLESARKLLLGAVLASRKHFDKEERIVFPMAERVLKAKTLTELGETWLRRREVAAK
jgi:hemerythrin-like domain-containing protein